MARNSKTQDQFWQFVRSYLTVNMPTRGLSPRTVESYGQSIASYCSFLKEKNKTEFSKVSFEQFSYDSVMQFIRWLREERNCGVASCNLRLSALKSLLKYCADKDLSLYAVYQGVKKVPLMKAAKMPVKYMSETALKALLAQPDIQTAKGVRNRMLMMLLYDTGTRVQELVNIKVGDLHLDARDPFIIVKGKGSKTRSIPLMDRTVAHLKEYLRRFHPNSDNRSNDPLFYSIRSGLPQMLSTDAVSVMLKHYGDAARETCPEVPKRVHPHLVRHTRATHLYRSGLPLSYIAEFLGHASVTTTEIYASASTEMIREALEKADPEMTQEIPSWKDEESLKKLCGL